MQFSIVLYLLDVGGGRGISLFGFSQEGNLPFGLSQEDLINTQMHKLSSNWSSQ